LELLRRGAGSAYGVDLSPKMIAQARQLAAAYKLEKQATFVVGDAAEIDLPKSDLVILDRVICCYPNMNLLLGRSLDACRGYYCFAVPRDRGWWHMLNKMIQGLVKVYLLFRRCGAGFYIHSIDRIEDEVQSRGFRKIFVKTFRIWAVMFYEAAADNLKSAAEWRA